VTMTHRGIFASASLAAIAPSAPPSPPTPAKCGGKYPARSTARVLWADNGTDSDVGHVDNDNSSTRFRIRGSADVTGNTQAGITWETEFESNTSSKFDINQNNDGSADFKERKLEAWYKGPWGKLSIGQGDGAANGTSEMDLSGTTVIAYSGLADMAGGITFKTTGGPISEKAWRSGMYSTISTD
jgi:predicted porin